MPRRPRHPPLRVLLNNRLVGHLRKAANGAIEFLYEETWLEWDHAFPISLSLPLRDDAYRGAEVGAVFDNLLPDSDRLRRRIAEEVGAEGTDSYNLLTAIGRDCVGALQFLPPDEDARQHLDHQDPDDGGGDSDISTTGPRRAGEDVLDGETLDDAQIEKLLKGLEQAPLGLTREDEFRISVAGAQEKTALLRLNGRWLKPHGTTPTTHIFKTPMGTLPNGIDLSHSVENEYYCLKLAAAFGLPVADAEIHSFGGTKALVIERFDRRWTREGRLLRLPQEDFCQALSVPPTRKYQSDGGPNLVQLLDLLKGSDTPAEDQALVFKAQILFWLIGATDGHAKNFSLHIGPGGSYRLTPLYDVLTAQPSLDAGQIDRNQFRLAMSVGKSRHYRMHEILGRHFVQTGEAASLPRRLIADAIGIMADQAGAALDKVEQCLPVNFPGAIHKSVKQSVLARLDRLATL